MLDSLPITAPAIAPTRARLIQAAAELIRRHSYGTVSVDDICKAADIKKGTFYHHFPSKNELALATFDHIWQEERAAFVATLNNPALTPEARLTVFAESIVALHRETYAREGKVYGCPLSNAGGEMGAQDEAIRCKIAAIFDDAVTLFAQMVAALPGWTQAPPIACREAARAMMCFMMGVEYQAKLANDPEVIARDLLPGLKRLLAVFPTE